MCYKYVNYIKNIEHHFLFKVEKYANDPLNWHGGIKAGWANAMLDAMDKIQIRSSTIKTPFLVAHGDADQIVKIDSSRFLHENSPSGEKTFKVRLLACWTIGIIGPHCVYRDNDLQHHTDDHMPGSLTECCLKL